MHEKDETPAAIIPPRLAHHVPLLVTWRFSASYSGRSCAHRLLDLLTSLFLIASASAAVVSELPVRIESLLAPDAPLPARVQHAGGILVETNAGAPWVVSGRSPATLVLVPAASNAWNVAGWNYLRLEIANDGPGIVTVEGRLDNTDARDWEASCPGFAAIPPGGRGTLGFPFNRAEQEYQGPKIFGGQLAKPDGLRVHWRRFDPADIRSIRLVLRSSSSKLHIAISDPCAAWPLDAARSARLEAMPYLDELGQVRALEWPGKVHGADELRGALQHERDAAQAATKPAAFDRFGGWADGPQLKATGNFRTEKYGGRWWLVDPDGRLFFSVGATGAGFKSVTPLTAERERAGFFAWLPSETDPLSQAGFSTETKRRSVNFPAMNMARAFGTNWNTQSRSLIHDQFRMLGLNTLAAWSAEDLMRDARTPYTITLSIHWPAWQGGDGRMPSPFSKDFEDALRGQLRRFAWAKEDPFCIGAFIDNELAWPDEFTPRVFEMPGWEPTRQWALAQLQAKYAEVAALNSAWGTHFADWQDFHKLSQTQIPRAASADIEPLYNAYAKAYFTRCRAVLNEVLPGKLYLGCRTHRGPKLIGRAAWGAVDVFSVNCYDTRAAAHQVDAATDIPVLVGEFHFGAVDRGVPGPGLRGVHDQTQRGYAFANYLASALADPRFVGVHWFQWLDHSAAARPDRENHQCGFADVTGRVYPEFGRIVARATRAMYPARDAAGKSVEKTLASLLVDDPP